MVEKRRFNRWHTEKGKDAVISCAGIKEKVKILDISATGMKISLSKPIALGAIIQAEFTVSSNLGPFFVKGRVMRVTEKAGLWEAAVEFEKVSTGKIDIN